MSDPVPTVKCPRCGHVSDRPYDVAMKFCVECHQFHENMVLVPERGSLLGQPSYRTPLPTAELLSPDRAPLPVLPPYDDLAAGVGQASPLVLPGPARGVDQPVGEAEGDRSEISS